VALGQIASSGGSAQDQQDQQVELSEMRTKCAARMEWNEWIVIKAAKCDG
jgi:hypothetical protein